MAWDITRDKGYDNEQIFEENLAITNFELSNLWRWRKYMYDKVVSRKLLYGLYIFVFILYGHIVTSDGHN